MAQASQFVSPSGAQTGFLRRPLPGATVDSDHLLGSLPGLTTYPLPKIDLAGLASLCQVVMSHGAPRMAQEFQHPQN